LFEKLKTGAPVLKVKPPTDVSAENVTPVVPVFPKKAVSIGTVMGVQWSGLLKSLVAPTHVAL
jgi:hypothetical protein